MRPLPLAAAVVQAALAGLLVVVVAVAADVAPAAVARALRQVRAWLPLVRARPRLAPALNPIYSRKAR